MFFIKSINILRDTIAKMQNREKFEAHDKKYVTNFFDEANIKIHPQIITGLSAGLLVALLANTITSFRIFIVSPYLEIIRGYWFIFLALTSLLIAVYCLATYLLLQILKHFCSDMSLNTSNDKFILVERIFRLAIYSTISFLIFLIVASFIWSLKDMYDAGIVLYDVYFVGIIQILIVLTTYLVWLIPYSFPFAQIYRIKLLINNRSYELT